MPRHAPPAISKPSPRRSTSTTSGFPGEAVHVGLLAQFVARFPETRLKHAANSVSSPPEGLFRPHRLPPLLRRGFPWHLTGPRTEGILR